MSENIHVVTDLPAPKSIFKKRIALYTAAATAVVVAGAVLVSKLNSPDEDESAVDEAIAAE